jgi:anti-sigma28 factor (negative regulator of flagellin synthesis)
MMTRLQVSIDAKPSAKLLTRNSKQVNELKKNIRDGRKFLDAHYFAVNTTVYAVWDTG